MPIKVLFCNRKVEWRGGDVMKMRKFEKALKYLGHSVTTTWPDDYIHYGKFDLWHLYNLNFPWSYRFALRAQSQKMPFVLSTIHFNTTEHVSKGQQLYVLKSAKKLIMFSKKERKAIEEFFNISISDDKCEYLPNGTSDMFRSFIPWKRRQKKVINVVNEFHPRKNLQNLAEACKRLCIKLIIVGPMGRYPQERKKVYNPYVRLEDRYVKHEELVSLYNEARVVCTPSIEDPYPNTVYEGINSGCNVIVSNKTYVNKKGVLFCDTSVESIMEVIKQAMEKQIKTEPFPTWIDQARKLVKIYNKIL